MQKKIFFVLLAGLIVRLVLLGFFYDNPNVIYEDDSHSYMPIAENLRLGNGFSEEPSSPYLLDAIRTPGYPLFLLAHRVIFGSYLPALITQSLLMVATAYVIYLIACRLGKPRIGILAAALMLFMPFSLLVSIQFLSQPLFTFFMALAIWTWINYLQTTKRSWLVASLMLIPILAYIRPIALFIPLLFILSYLYTRRSVKVPVLILISFFIILSPWMYRNYKIFGHYQMTSQGPIQLYFYDLPAIYGTANHISYDTALAVLTKEIAYLIPPGQEVTGHWYGFRNFTNTHVLTDQSLHYIKKYPVATVITRAKEAVMFFLRDGVRYWFNAFHAPRGARFIVFASMERLLLLAMMVGCGYLFLRLLKGKYPREIAVGLFAVFCAVGYSMALTGALASAGFRLPVEGLFFLLGFFGWSEIIA